MSGLFTEDIMYHYKNCNDELRQDSIQYKVVYNCVVAVVVVVVARQRKYHKNNSK